jgi:hypothetical protein
MREANKRGENLGLRKMSWLFIKCLKSEGSAVARSGDEAIQAMTCELMIGWNIQYSVRAKQRTTIRRLWQNYG